MNNKNFTAQEIKTLQKTAMDVFKEIVEAIKAVKQACSTMSSVVASGDSNLSGKWSSIADSIAGPITTADNSFNFIGDILNSFVEQTVSNEQTAESDLGSIDAEIGALGAVANSLVDLGSAIGGAAAGAVGGAASALSGVAGAGAAAGEGAAAGIGTGLSGGAGAGSAITGIGGDLPPVIYAPPTPSTPTPISPIGGGTVNPPSVVYAPPTPGTGSGSGGGGGTFTPPSVVYAPPTPSTPTPISPIGGVTVTPPTVVYAPPTPGLSGTVIKK